MTDSQVCSESTIESANRRSFIKKAVLASAAVGLAGTALEKSSSLLPESSAESFAKTIITTDTATRNQAGNIAVFDGKCDITGASGNFGPAVLSRASCSAALCVTNTCTALCCQAPVGISGHGTWAGVSGTSCNGYGSGVCGYNGSCGAGVSGTTTKEGPGVFGWNEYGHGPGVCGLSGGKGPGVSARSFYGAALVAKTCYPTIGTFHNNGSCPDKSALLEVTNGCSTPISWYAGVGGSGNKHGLSSGQFFIEEKCSPKLVVNTCGKVGIGTITPNATLQVNGGMSLGIRTEKSNYTMTSSDFALLADATSGSINISLPTAANAGQVVYLKKIDSSGNTINVQAQGSDKIENSSSFTLPSQFSSVTLIAGGKAVWYILSNSS